MNDQTVFVGPDETTHVELQDERTEVLLIDDGRLDPALVERMTNRMAESGYDVTVASDAPEKRDPKDIIVVGGGGGINVGTIGHVGLGRGRSTLMGGLMGLAVMASMQRGERIVPELEEPKYHAYTSDDDPYSRYRGAKNRDTKAWPLAPWFAKKKRKAAKAARKLTKKNRK